MAVQLATLIFPGLGTLWAKTPPLWLHASKAMFDCYFLEYSHRTALELMSNQTGSKLLPPQQGSICYRLNQDSPFGLKVTIVPDGVFACIGSVWSV